MPYYSTGTASTIAGQAVVTGTGTAWALSLVTGGMFNSRGFSVPIKSVESNQSLTLEYPWPGTSFSGAYAVDLDRAEAASAVIANRRLAELLAKVETMTGPPGARGRDGPTTVNVGETVTVPYNEGAEVINVGDARDVLLEFRVPIGPQGELSAQDRAFFNAAVADAVQSATSAGAASQDTNADRVQTGQDRVKTAEDRVATGQDRAAIASAKDGTAADRAQTALDRVATGEDRAATAADRIKTGEDRAKTTADAAATAADRAATGEDRVRTTSDAVATAADRVKTTADVQATAADRVQTGEDRNAISGAQEATADDRVQTGQDRVKTTADAAATAADRVQTGQDRTKTTLDAAATDADATATAADRVATGQDKAATAADRVATGQDKVATAADVVKTAADRAAIAGAQEATAADRVQTGQDRAATAADRAATGQDRADTAADRVQTGQDRAVAVDAANAAAGSAEAALTNQLAAKGFRQETAADRAATGQDRAAIAGAQEATAADRALAQTARALSQSYATAPVDVEVEPGKYSAYHWSEKSRLSSLGNAANIAFVPADGMASDTVQEALLEVWNNVPEIDLTNYATTAQLELKANLSGDVVNFTATNVNFASNVTAAELTVSTSATITGGLNVSGDSWFDGGYVSFGQGVEWYFEDLPAFQAAAGISEKVTGPATSDIGDLAQFSGTNGKTLMRKSVASVLGTALATTGAVRVAPLDTDQFGLSDTNEVFRRVTWLNMKGYFKTFVDSFKAAAFGYASLDGSGKIPLSQIPDSLVGNVSYQGVWNAATNSPAIPAAAAANKGHYRIVNTTGSTNINGITDWRIGDWIISDGTAWGKIDNTDAVWGVAGLTGDISRGTLRSTLDVANFAETGASFGVSVADSATDLSKHLRLYAADHGFNITANTMNIVTPGQSHKVNVIAGSLTLNDQPLALASAIPPNAFVGVVLTNVDLNAIVTPSTYFIAYGGGIANYPPIPIDNAITLEVQRFGPFLTQRVVNAYGLWLFRYSSDNGAAWSTWDLPSDSESSDGYHILQGVTNLRFISPKSMTDGVRFRTFTPNSINLKNFINGAVTLTSNQTFAAPTGAIDGRTFTFAITQGGAGGFTAVWNTFWDFGKDGPPTLSTAPGVTDLVTGIIMPGATKALCTFKAGA